MELKQLVTQLVYRIEPKPEGGFIARPSDPAVAPLEAATREELQQKIRAAIAASLTAQFPALKLGPEGKVRNFAFHIEKNPAGGFVLHSADPQSPPIGVDNHQDLETRIAEKLVNFVGKNLGPGLAQALAQAQSGDLNVNVNRKIAFTLKVGSPSLIIGQNLPADSTQPDSANIADSSAQISKTTFSGPAVTNAPITPESSGNWTPFLFIAFLLTLAALVYLLLHR